MSSSSPVPCFSAPNCAVAYHWLIQGWAGLPPIARAARCESSPSPRPAGPNAATLAGASACTAAGVAVEGLAASDDWVALARAELPWTAGALAGGLVLPSAGEGRGLVAAAGWDRPTPETNL